MTDIRQLSSQLTKYGFSDNEVKIYLFLLRESHELSVVQIARSLKLGRTPVYNALDKLEAKGLVAKIVSDNGYNFAATSPDHLERYWQAKSANIQHLGERLPVIVSALESMTVTSGYQSQVNYFTGRRGLEQITYNTLRAERDLYIYEVAANMNVFTSQNTAESFRRTLVERQVTTHQLTNFTEFTDYTEVEELITDFWDIRHISPDTLHIKFEMVIYNDICALYSVEDKEAFGVEIKNPNLAEMQIQIFKAMQHLSTPLKKHGSHGSASL